MSSDRPANVSSGKDDMVLSSRSLNTINQDAAKAERRKARANGVSTDKARAEANVYTKYVEAHTVYYME